MRLDLETGLKVCPACKESKSADAFWRSSRHSDGLQIRCRKCKTGWRNNNYEHYLILACRNRARAEDVPCTITEVDISIPSNCPLPSCQRPLEKKTGRAGLSSPSIDRYDPRLGYVPDNIWIICFGCNRNKQNMSGEQHVSFGLELIDAFKEYRDRVA